MRKMGLASSPERRKALEVKILEGELTLYELRLLSLTLGIITHYELIPHDDAQATVVIS